MRLFALHEFYSYILFLIINYEDVGGDDIKRIRFIQRI